MPPERMQKSEQQPHGSTPFGTALTSLGVNMPQASELWPADVSQLQHTC